MSAIQTETNINPSTYRLSQKMMPDTKKLKKPKMYRLCKVSEAKTDRYAVSESTGMPVVPMNPMYALDSVAYVFDEYESDPFVRNKIIRNVVGSKVETQNGKPVVTEELAPVIFENGIFMVLPNKVETYVFMERHPLNKSNKYRDTSKQPLFEAVEEAEAVALLSEFERITFMADASQIIRDAKFDDKRAMAKATGVSGWESMDAKELVISLTKKAEQDPRDFIMKSFDEESKCRVQLSDAKILGLIECFPENKTWRFTDEGKETICEYKEGDVPEEALFKFLVSNKGAEKYKALATKIKDLIN